jgi:hypothetical protein
MAEDPQQAASTNIPRGAIVTTAYVERKVIAYAVLESEIDLISFFNTLTIIFFSAGSSFASIAIGIWVSGKFTEKLSPEAAILANIVAPSLLVVAIGLACIGIWAFFNKKTALDAIRAESLSKG